MRWRECVWDAARVAGWWIAAGAFLWALVAASASHPALAGPRCVARAFYVASDTVFYELACPPGAIPRDSVAHTE